jgi:hypothetical protein
LAGLPDGIVSNQKNPIRVNFGEFCKWKVSVFVMAIWSILHQIDIFYGHLVYFVVIWYILWSFGIFCGHLVYFVVIWYILWSFGIFCGNLVYFPLFGMLYKTKSGNPAVETIPTYTRFL